jgi:hypothetical protein
VKQRNFTGVETGGLRGGEERPGGSGNRSENLGGHFR